MIEYILIEQEPNTYKILNYKEITKSDMSFTYNPDGYHVEGCYKNGERIPYDWNKGYIATDELYKIRVDINMFNNYIKKSSTSGQRKFKRELDIMINTLSRKEKLKKLSAL